MKWQMIGIKIDFFSWSFACLLFEQELNSRPQLFVEFKREFTCELLTLLDGFLMRDDEDNLFEKGV